MKTFDNVENHKVMGRDAGRGDVVEGYHAFIIGRTQENRPEAYSAAIHLIGEDDHWLGRIAFVDEKYPRGIPADHTGPSGEHYMYLPLSQFPNVIDLLRNEKPIYFGFDSRAVLSTLKEPVGVGERQNPRLPPIKIRGT